MPIGSLLLGWCVGQFGAREAVLVPVLGMLTVTLTLALTTRLWQIRSDNNDSEVSGLRPQR